MAETSRSREKDRTRAAILAAAISEYGRRGIAATRASDVAQAAGVSHGAVFAHFGSQEALICAAIEALGGGVAARTHELAGGGGSLGEILAAHLAGLREFEPFYARLVAEAGLLPPVAGQTLVSIQSAISFHLSQAATREMAEGRVRPMPVHLLFNTWQGLIEHYLLNAELFAPGGSVLERRGGELLDHFMALISTDAARRALDAPTAGSAPPVPESHNLRSSARENSQIERRGRT